MIRVLAVGFETWILRLAGCWLLVAGCILGSGFFTGHSILYCALDVPGSAF